MILLLAALLMPGDSLPALRPALTGPASVPGNEILAPWTPQSASGDGVLPHPSFLPQPLSAPSGLSLPPGLGLKAKPGVEAASYRPGGEEEAPRQLVEYSDGYLTRLKIHKYASYATLPLFAAAYVTGNELIKNGGNAASWARNTHGTIAGSLAVLFGVNTITGVWNLYEGRNDPEGRGRRILHSVLLLAADAGFLATAALAGESEDGGWNGGGGGDLTAHRAMAITSMGLAFTGYLTMTWPFRRD